MPRIEFKTALQTNPDTRGYQNYISTTLYHFYDFLPLSLWNQVSRPANIYFIVQCIVSFFPQISTISVPSAVGPVVFIIMFSLCFDWAEDFLRYLKDRRANMRKASVWREGRWAAVEYQHVRPGDLVKVAQDAEVCADLLLLTAKTPAAAAYIETASLDGEKNLKPRLPVFERFLTADPLAAYPDIEVDYQPPVEFLEKFEGSLQATSAAGTPLELRLGIANFLPRSSVLKNTQEAVGLALFTGSETKVMQNTKARRVKLSIVERLMNVYILVLVLLLLAALFFLATYGAVSHSVDFDFGAAFIPNEYSPGVLWLFTVLRYFLIMNTIVPISLIVTLQIAKTVMSAFYLLEKKKDKLRIRINTMNIHEELGQIEYVLSDKTGTLTQNKMVLRHFATPSKTFTFGPGQTALAAVPFLPFALRSVDGASSRAFDEEPALDSLFFVTLNTCHECFAESKAAEERGPEGLARDPLAEKDVGLGGQSLGLESADVTMTPSRPGHLPSDRSLLTPRSSDSRPVADNFRTVAKDVPGQFSADSQSLNETLHFRHLRQNIEIQGPSPDEIAILRASKNSCGFLFKGSTASETVVMDREGRDIVVRLLQVNRFNSFRRMMSVVGELEGQKYLFVKGADSAVAARLKSPSSLWEKETLQRVSEQTDKFVAEGLRVLHVAVRLLSDEEWAGFSERIREANKAADYEAQMEAILGQLESGMTLLGATAVEDQLQTGLRETVEQLRKANIKLWVITGDKLETAENIAYSANVFSRDRQLVALRHLEDLERCDDPASQDLIVDGEFFGALLAEGGAQAERFRTTVMKCPSVVFSRTNANQKVEVVRIVRGAGKVALAVGDGANDVNMIQEANVGVGIRGEEGQQAANSADFAVERFAELGELLFNHGRLSYNRVSDLIMFFFYKNFMFTVPQFVYAFYCDFSGTTLFVDYYITFYNLLFTAFVASARSVYNKDVYGYGDANNRLVEVYTYYVGQESLGLNARNFSLWLVGGIGEVCLLFFFVFGCFQLEGYGPAAGEATYEFVSMLVFAAIVFHQVNKISYQTNIFLAIQALFYSTGYWFFIVYLLVTNYVQTGGMYRVNAQLWAAGGFWLPFSFALALLFLLSLLYYKLQELLCPTVFTMVRRRVERSSDESCEPVLRAIVAEQRSQRGILKWLFN